MATKKATTKRTRGAKKTTRKTAPKRSRAKATGQAAARDPRLPAVGTVLTREFKGKTVEVKVTEAGFEYEDQTFKSISAVARRITGYMVSGPVFFRLDKPSEAD
ncbi:MAG: DUF2924 domain-containing protein [Krumholzibacteria bacterium]|nr:DUF2924 domain-containing protein [Candidatus Krumholzibacteria bacterium]